MRSKIVTRWAIMRASRAVARLVSGVQFRRSRTSDSGTIEPESTRGSRLATVVRGEDDQSAASFLEHQGTRQMNRVEGFHRRCHRHRCALQNRPCESDPADSALDLLQAFL